MLADSRLAGSSDRLISPGVVLGGPHYPPCAGTQPTTCNVRAGPPQSVRQGELMKTMKPFYRTECGEAYLGDSLDVMACLPDRSVNLIVTSPPFPLTFQKRRPYGTVHV